MRLVVGKRATSPTVPMILAARVRDLCRRSLGEGGAGRSYLFFYAPIQVSDLSVERSDVAQHLRKANRRRRRAEAPPWGRMPRRMRAARSLESVPATPPGTRSRRSPCKRLSARVRSATRSSRLSESRRSTSEPISGSTATSLALREAARARWRGHRAHRFCGRCRSREHPHPRRRELGRHVHHRLASRCQPPRQVPTPSPLTFSTAQRRSGNRLAQRSRDLRPSLGSAGI